MFVDDIEHAVFTSIMGMTLDKIVGPDMVRVLRAKPHAGTVVEPQAALLRLLGGHFQPLTLPDPPDTTLDVHHPPGLGQQGHDPAVPVATILAGKGDDIRAQRRLIVSGSGKRTLRGAMLPQNPANPALGQPQLRLHMLDAGTATCGA